MKLSARNLARTPCKSTTQLGKVGRKFTLGSESPKQTAKIKAVVQGIASLESFWP